MNEYPYERQAALHPFKFNFITDTRKCFTETK